jgi:hypothetical protein
MNVEDILVIFIYFKSPNLDQPDIRPKLDRGFIFRNYHKPKSTGPMLEAPTIGGSGEDFPGQAYLCNICREAAWHQWDDFTTAPGLSSSSVQNYVQIHQNTSLGYKFYLSFGMP